MKYRKLGQTGVEVSAIGLGGSHLGKSHLSAEESVKIMRSAMDRGLTFLDNSWDYHHGESERRMGKALGGGYREKAFLMTKIDGRSKKTASKQLDESLRRLKVEQIDLVQHHEVIRFEDVDRILAEGGAMEALLEARDKGKIRYIGFTGHKDPSVHLYMLEMAERAGVRLDAVQMPLNLLDAHFRSFEKQVLPRLTREGIGVLGMKSLASGVLLKLPAISARDCLRYALTLPTSVVIVGIDSMEYLEEALGVAEHFSPMEAAEMEALRAKTAAAAAKGEYELFKTTTVFDSTAQHPEYLGEESERTLALAGR